MCGTISCHLGYAYNADLCRQCPRLAPACLGLRLKEDVFVEGIFVRIAGKEYKLFLKSQHQTFEEQKKLLERYRAALQPHGVIFEISEAFSGGRDQLLERKLFLEAIQ